MNLEEQRKDAVDARSSSGYHVAGALEDISDKIYEIMLEQGLNKSQLAAKLGRSRAWVGKLISGDHNMTIKTAVEVLYELGYQIHFDMKAATDTCEEPNVNYVSKISA